MSQLICVCQPLSAAGILQIHLVTEGSRMSSVGYTQDCHIPIAPPNINTPPLYEEAPMLLPCLIMWARCLGVSLCHPVVLSASIMPLSGRLATAAHSLFLFVCLSVCVSAWSSNARNSFPLLLNSSHIAQKTRDRQGWPLQCRGCPH